MRRYTQTPIHIVLAATFWLLIGASAQAGETRLLTEGDQLSLVIPAYGKTKRKIVVDEDGKIPVTPHGHIRVAGLSLVEAEKAVKKRIKRYVHRVRGVKLRLLQRRVLVTGQVKKPGLVEIEKDADIWQAIQSAGGLIKGAYLARVIHIQEGIARTLDLHAYLTREHVQALAPLNSGDTIFVPATAGLPMVEGSEGAYVNEQTQRDKVFVLGAVKNPGMYDRSPQLNALSAISLADGPDNDAHLSQVKVIGHGGTHTVNLTDWITGADHAKPLPDMKGLVIFVPRQPQNRTLAFGGSVEVMGMVKHPGSYAVDDSTPLLQILGTAGGPIKEADLANVRVVRRGKASTLTMGYNVNTYLQDGGVVGMMTVRPGDTVFVNAESGFWSQLTSILSSIAVVSAAMTIFAGL